MKDDYNKVMSQRTNEELEIILTTQRSQYKPEAISAAEKEIEKRNIIPSKTVNIDSTKPKKTETNEALLKELLIVNKENKKHTEQILKNVKFFFWITMISIIGTVIMTMMTLK
jgi:hypothetical protein